MSEEPWEVAIQEVFVLQTLEEHEEPEEPDELEGPEEQAI